MIYFNDFSLYFFLQGLTNARKKEIDTENHMLMIAQREEGRLKQEVRKLEKELEEFKEKKNVFEVLFFNFSVLCYDKACKYYNYLMHNLVCQKLIQYINIDTKQICCTAD